MMQLADFSGRISSYFAFAVQWFHAQLALRADRLDARVTGDYALSQSEVRLSVMMLRVGAVIVDVRLATPLVASSASLHLQRGVD